MFFQKKKQSPESDKPAAPTPDFMVRNMPKPQALSGVSYQSAGQGIGDGRLRTVAPAAGNNFKKVGLVIISGGIIVVISLVYLSYLFIIKPSVKKPAVNTAPRSANNSPNLASATPPLMPEVVIATSAADLLTTGTSSDGVNGLETTSPATSSDLVVAPAPIIDSDSDGLNDEEEAILGTNSNSLDSDGDTYNDLAEINNNYNPAGGGQLGAAANLGIYLSPVGGYQLLRPKNWPQEAIDDDNTIIFKAPDDSLIQISLQPNVDKQSILGWYGSAFPTSLITYDKLKNVDRWEGIAGDDGLNFYLTDQERQFIYVISYIPSDERRLAYPNIFQLMINSLQIK